MIFGGPESRKKNTTGRRNSILGDHPAPNKGGALGNFGQREGEKMKMLTCTVCKKEIPDTHPHLSLSNNRDAAICMGCEGVEIDVYRVSLPGQKSGYYESDIGNIADMIKDSDYDSGYTVIKEKMLAARYHNLPEFAGF